MSKVTRSRVLCAFTMVCLVLAACRSKDASQSPGPQTSDADSASKFVQDFYDWYVPIASGAPGDGPAWNAVLQRVPPILQSELQSDLQADMDSRAKAQEVVGLDFDPFLNSQDPCQRYVVGKVKETGGSYLVDVHSVCDGKKDENAAVVAELLRQDSSWIFTNFHTADGHDLRSVLKALRQK